MPEPMQILTIAWGWDGITAAVAFLIFAVCCVLFAAISLDSPPRRLRDLACGWRAPLLLAIALCGVVASIDELWAAFHVGSTQVTVRALDTEYLSNGDEIYFVDATDGRRFKVREKLHGRLSIGDRVQCMQTRPLIRTRALLSCAAQAPQ